MPTEVLYRKYRPDSFSKLVGQDSLRDLLVSQINSQKVAHGYLFTGPRGTGKTTTARLLAKAINCLSWTEKQDVCNRCDHCVMFNESAAVDFVEIDAASNRGIDEIRKIKESSVFLPLQFKYKIYVIDEAHMLTKDAFNSLLKILEEAPAHVIFILATTEVHKVPLTVASRLQRFDFHLAPKQVLAQKLQHIAHTEGWEIPEDLIGQLHRLSGGSFRDAESLLGKITPLLDSKKTTDEILQHIGMPALSALESLIDSLEQGKQAEVSRTFNQLVESNIDPVILLQQLMDLLLTKVSNSPEDQRLIGFLAYLSEHYAEVKYGYNPEKVLLLTLLSLASKSMASMLATTGKTANIAEVSLLGRVVDQNTQRVGSEPANVKSIPTTSSEKQPTKVSLPSVPKDKEKFFVSVISSLRQKNMRLANMVQNSKLLSIEGNLIRVATDLVLTFEILNKAASKQLIAAVINELTGDPSWQFVCEKVSSLGERKPVEVKNDDQDSSQTAESGAKLSNKNLVESIFTT